MSQAITQQELAARLRQLLGADPMGLVDPPYTTVLYVERKASGELWHTYDGDPHPVSKRAVRGHLDGLRTLVSRSEAHGDSTKLRVYFDAGDARYAVQTGAGTAFAESLLNQLAQLTTDEVAQPITLALKPADESDKVVFADLFAGHEAVYAGDGYSDDRQALFNRVRHLLGEENDDYWKHKGGRKEEGNGGRHRDFDAADRPESSDARARQETPPDKPARNGPPAGEDTISTEQAHTLWARAQEQGYDEEDMKRLLGQYGFDSFETIPERAFSDLMADVGTPPEAAFADDDLPF